MKIKVLLGTIRQPRVNQSALRAYVTFLHFCLCLHFVPAEGTAVETDPGY